MNKKLFLYFCTALIFLSTLTILLFGFPKDEADNSQCDYCSSLTPTAKQFKKINTPFPHYLALDKQSQKPIAVIFETAKIAPEVQGYGGEINIAVAVNLECKIIDLTILSHQETPEYVKGLSNFLGQFVGLSYKNKFVLGDDLDAMSGATISSQAINEAVHLSLKKVCKDILKLAPHEMEKPETIISTTKKEILDKSGIKPQTAKYWKTLKD